ncbi:MAG: outer membrane protein assembly factor BamD [Rhodospirillaceae bacterium]|nr:outer membrane protein assembly factor BamD [Rhodospirillaceae bacterium]|tara:strand:- start:12563 stop:13387 length:825 start_codon:yes stop_codon:yes gene_type:complete
MRLGSNIFVVICIMIMSGCQTNQSTEYVERPVNALYNKAMDNLQLKKWSEAAELFDEVERQHPYSTWATKAQLMAGYSHYQANRYTDALISFNRFIQLHPGNKDIAYAYYLRALSYYEQISDVSRDQGPTQMAFKMLKEVVNRFPTSKYARDARLKMDLTRDHLAGKEMAVGRYYQKKGQFLAAINRFKLVVKRYETTTHVPEALHRLAESYSAINMEEEANKVASVLGFNYPGSNWYMDTYKLITEANTNNKVLVPEKKQKRGFFSRAWNSIF